MQRGFESYYVNESTLNTYSYLRFVIGPFFDVNDGLIIKSTQTTLNQSILTSKEQIKNLFLMKVFLA
jgi:hypothetical protein